MAAPFGRMMTGNAQAALPIADSITGSARRRGLRVLLALLSILVFGRSLGNGFVTWDDEPLIYGNANIALPTAGGLKRQWTAPHIYLYIPLTYTAWWAIARLEQVHAGEIVPLDPAAFHAGNMAVHILSVMVVFGLLRRLVGRDWPAAAGAAMFAVHPLQVEAVAWATGMKDLLGGFLSLAALAVYVAGVQDTRAGRRGWIVATALFAAALLAKPSTVVTPLIAGVVDWLILRRPLKSVAQALWFWLVMAAGSALLTRHFQPAVEVAAGPWWARPLVAGDALTFYLRKLAWPIHLGMDYGRTPASVLAGDAAILGWIAPAAIALILWKAHRAELTAAAIIFVIALLPVLGWVPFEFQIVSTVADRYMYVAMLGPGLALAYGATRIPRAPAVTLCGAALLFWSVLSWLQVGVWHDSASLYQHALTVNPESLTATQDLAVVYDRSGQSARAIDLYLRAVEIDPQRAEGYDNLVMALPRAQDERPQWAGRWAAIHEQVARFYFAHGRYAEAQKQFAAAGELEPSTR
jgi:hypothetical protein